MAIDTVFLDAGGVLVFPNWQRAGARPETTLHVGDLFHIDVLGARAAGLRAVLLDMAGLCADVDCERVRSLAELADLLGA